MRAVDIGLYAIIFLGIVSWIAWPNKGDSQAKAEAVRKRMVEATLIEALPDDFVDTLDAQLLLHASIGSDSVAIWSPGSIPGVEGNRPIWTGTANDLRKLLESRRHRD